MTQTLSKSPLMRYTEAFDLKYLDYGYTDYWRMAIQTDPKAINALLMEEIKFREQFFANFVFSVEGTQGTGKSSFMLRLNQILGEQYGNPFDLKNCHFFHEDMQEDLKHYKERTTYCQDEQPRIFGVMSSFLQEELANYEDIYRKPQVNIGYASPSLRRHEHFFIFETYGDIYLDKETGQPSGVEAMLKLRRFSDSMIMPRGKVKLSWVAEDFWDKYNKKKDIFIKKMGGKKGDRLKILEKYANDVIKKYKSNLYTLSGSGSIKMKDKYTLDYYLNKSAGMGNLTSEGRNQARSILKELLLENFDKK